MGESHRDLIAGLLEQIAQDPAFRQRLQENPRQALEQFGFAQQLQELEPDPWNAPEVSGYGCADTCFNRWTCLSDSCYITI